MDSQKLSFYLLVYSNTDSQKLTNDVLGYANNDETFAGSYTDFYNEYSAQYDKHFILGETGTTDGSVSAKEAWLKQVASQDYSSFPNYQGAMWFEVSICAIISSLTRTNPCTHSTSRARTSD